MLKLKCVGILGGMGPAASGQFFNILIQKLNDKGVSRESDFPEIILFSVPLPDWDENGFVIRSIEGNERLIQSLKNYIKRLTDMGVEVIAMPCNSIHFMYDIIQSSTHIKVLNILQETSNHIKEKGYKKVKLFSTRSTKDLKLYDFIDPIKTTEEEQIILDDILEAAIAGVYNEKHKYMFKTIIEDSYDSGAEAIILGCTELPLLIDQKDTHVPLINTTEILSNKLTSEII